MADPGFPVGARGPVREGRGLPTRALFAKNVCENERIGAPPPRSANGVRELLLSTVQLQCNKGLLSLIVKGVKV